MLSSFSSLTTVTALSFQSTSMLCAVTNTNVVEKKNFDNDNNNDSNSLLFTTLISLNSVEITKFWQNLKQNKIRKN